MRTCNIKIKHTGIKRKAGKERAGNSGSEKEAEKYREKTEAASRETKVVLEEKSIQTAEGLQKVSTGCLGLPCLGKKYPKVLWRKFWNITCPQNSWKKSASA